MKFISALAWLERTSKVWKAFFFLYFSDEWSQILYEEEVTNIVSIL